MIRKLLAVVLAATLLAAAGFGCQPAKKPIPAPAPPSKTTPKMTPTPAKKPMVQPMPTTSPEMHKLATKLAAQAATAPGVKKATVVLTNTVAYVGLDLKANIEGSKTETIKKEVADKVKMADKRLTKVYVSTDIDTVTRIKKAAEGIGKGKPISSFANELSEIGRRIIPKTTK